MAEITQDGDAMMIGQSIIYCDPTGVDHFALITTYWNENMVNLVYVSENENERDQYGRQTKHVTSTPRVTGSNIVHGNYFRYLTDHKKDFVAPEQV